MNNPFLLKTQLKNNEEELSNYLRDMNIWHEQMKRKEPSPPVKVWNVWLLIIIIIIKLQIKFLEFQWKEKN